MKYFFICMEIWLSQKDNQGKPTVFAIPIRHSSAIIATKYIYYNILNRIKKDNKNSRVHDMNERSNLQVQVQITEY